MVNRGVLGTEHFDHRGDAGVLLNDRGRPRFLDFYDRAVSTEFHDRPTGATVTFRLLMQRQAQRARQAIMGEGDYQPCVFR